jgi:hypothetical protein
MVGEAGPAPFIAIYRAEPMTAMMSGPARHRPVAGQSMLAKHLKT